MKRLVQILFIAAWLVGAVAGHLPRQPSASGAEDGSMHLLVDTEYARLGADQSQIVLSVELSGHAEWRATAPMPALLAPKWSEAPSSQSGTAAQRAVVTFLIYSLSLLP